MDALPQELVDRIIDSCDDSRTFKACGLVCKRWTYATRSHLFNKLTVCADGLPHIVDLIDDSSSPILSFIQNLTLNVAPDALDDTLLARLHPCPNLRRITVLGRDANQLRSGDAMLPDQLHAIQSHLRSWVADSPHSISSLHLNLPTTSLSLETIMGVITSFPCLRVLHVEGFLAHEPAPPPSVKLECPLQTLSVQGCGKVLFSWLLTLPSVPALSSLSVGPFDDDVKPLIRFIQDAGSGLRSLKLDNTGTSWDEALSQTRDILQHIPQGLQHFSCQCYFAREIPEILLLLPPEACQRLRSIKFIVSRTQAVAERDEVSWADFDGALADPRFKGLLEFTMHASETGKNHVSMMTEEVKVLLARAVARGILVRESTWN
ncbi:hypothetical protein FB45DRAFT_941437 [Roridomyces roridus]|uniref:F-box domain-containing protein n=1 Tax=Roridomyces roridus TaxID=1738132 RepID=A0AAD7F9Z1_9AGAR|nr:hypothetical protein FB45DRAFT_941437 [Roridomyces roridus]